MKAITLMEAMLVLSDNNHLGLAVNYVQEPISEFIQRKFCMQNGKYEIKEGKLYDSNLFDSIYLYAYEEPLMDPRPGRAGMLLTYNAKIDVTLDGELCSTVFIYKVD